MIELFHWSSLLLVSAATAAFQTLFVYLPNTFGILECVALAAPLGFSLSAWIVLAVKSLPFMPLGIPVITVIIATAIQLAVCLFLFNRTVVKLKLRSKEIVQNLKQHRFGILMLSIMFVWWSYMSHIHYLYQSGSSFFGGGSVYADLPFHTNLVTSFLNGCNEDSTLFSTLRSPFYAGAPLAYPFLPDFYVAVLTGGGYSMRYSLVITGALLLSSLFSLVYCFTYRVSNKVSASMISVWVSLLTGGLGGYYYIKSNPNWWRLSTFLSSEFVHGPDHVFYWVNKMSAFWFSLPAHILFPQRTVQHAYPLAVGVILFLWLGVQALYKSVDNSSSVQNTSAVVKNATYSPLRREVGAAIAPALLPLDATPDSPYFDSAVSDKPSSGIRRRVIAPVETHFENVGNEVQTHSVGKNESNPVRFFLFAGICSSLLPLMQPHSFLASGIVAIFLALAQVTHVLYVTFLAPPSKGRSYKYLLVSVQCWLAFGLVAFAFGLPQFVVHFMHRLSFGVGTSSDSFVRLATSWAEEKKGEGPIRTIWKGTGLYIPSLFIGVLALPSRLHMSLFVGLSVLFIVCHTIMFQPWHWDNTKLLAFWVFGSAPFASHTVAQLPHWIAKLAFSFGIKQRARKPRKQSSAELEKEGRYNSRVDFPIPLHLPRYEKPKTKFHPLASLSGLCVAASLFIALVFSGFLACFREMLNKGRIYSLYDLDYAAYINEHVPKDAVFLHNFNKGNHIRPESSLAGRQVAVGYPGWLQSHGLDYSLRMKKLTPFLQGDPRGILGVLEIGVTHVTMDSNFAVSPAVLDFFDDVAILKAKSVIYYLWEVHPDILDGSYTFGTACPATKPNITESECLANDCWYIRDYVNTAGESTPCLAKPKKDVPDQVIDCMPRANTNADLCSRKKCIWKVNYPGPWCQQPRWMYAYEPDQIPLSMTPLKGWDCGWSSMTPDDCTSQGCLWIPSTDRESPWCTFP